MFINFMCEPTVSAANTDYICYSTPIFAARALIDPEMAESEIAYPSDEVLAKTERYKNLDADANQLMDDLWISGVRTNELTPGFWVAVGIICIAVIALVIRNTYIRKKRLDARMKY